MCQQILPRKKDFKTELLRAIIHVTGLFEFGALIAVRWVNYLTFQNLANEKVETDRGILLLESTKLVSSNIELLLSKV